MSAFLGPIHYWLYNKVQVEDQMTKAIVEKAMEKGLLTAATLDTADQKYGTILNQSLEEMIDTDNIHGWLQDRVSVAEGRLAFFVTEIIEKNSDAKEEILETAKCFGHDLKRPEFHSVKEVYQFIMDTLLDGMPCDHVNSIELEEADRLVYKRNHCVHEAYWQAVNGDVTKYYEIRQAMLEGMLEGSGFAIRQNGNQSEIVKLG
ncbi:MAG: hypothetical protein E7256_11325 [Lachnospiraceae bacterium]|nr:hypothetical protein [Lachnospiraceae bacterium]